MEYSLHTFILIRNFTQGLSWSVTLMCFLPASGQMLAQWSEPINAAQADTQSGLIWTQPNLAHISLATDQSGASIPP